jgi:hypothetical protein
MLEFGRLVVSMYSEMREEGCACGACSLDKVCSGIGDCFLVMGVDATQALFRYYRG